MKRVAVRKFLLVATCVLSLTAICSLDLLPAIAVFCRNRLDLFLLGHGYASFSSPLFLSASQPPASVSIFHSADDSARLKELLASLSESFPERDPFGNAKRCALVGNSSRLAGSGLGKTIDSFDTVVRFNEAPSIGYESDVGTRTSIRWVNSRRMPPSNEPTEGVSLVTTIFFREDLSLIQDRMLRGEYRPFSIVRIVSPELTSWVAQLVGHGPSSGIIATLTAVLKCEEVAVFGLRPGKDGLWSHYFPKETPVPSYHAIDNEQRLLATLERGKLIKRF